MTDVNTPELRLPKPPGVFRRWLAAHPRFVDGGIVITYLFGCAMMILFEIINGMSMRFIIGSEGLTEEAATSPEMGLIGWPWVLVLVAIIGLTTCALVYRRRFPLAGLIVVSLLLLLEQGMLVAPNSVALVFLLYAIPIYCGVRAGWIGFAVASILQTVLMLMTGATGSGVLGPAGLLAAGPLDLQETITLSVMNTLWLLAVLMIGINFGNRRRYVAALIDRAHQLAREREQRAQLAAASERARIAREMHDIVAHSLSVVVTLSEAASVSVQTQPEAAGKAMALAAETGRSALVEMRRLLGVLGEGEDTPAETTSSAHEHDALATRAPQPGLDQLQHLVDGFSQAGLRVQFTESGVVSGDATHQLAVFRISQEALTNALRYAGRGAEARIVIAHLADRTTIEVTDSGRIGSSGSEVEETSATLPGSGRGLAGAAERARLFGGSLEAGPHGAGWRVQATVPIGTAVHDTLMRREGGEDE